MEHWNGPVLPVEKSNRIVQKLVNQVDPLLSFQQIRAALALTDAQILLKLGNVEARQLRCRCTGLQQMLQLGHSHFFGLWVHELLQGVHHIQCSSFVGQRPTECRQQGLHDREPRYRKLPLNQFIWCFDQCGDWLPPNCSEDLFSSQLWPPQVWTPCQEGWPGPFSCQPPSPLKDQTWSSTPHTWGLQALKMLLRESTQCKWHPTILLIHKRLSEFASQGSMIPCSSGSIGSHQYLCHHPQHPASTQELCKACTAKSVSSFNEASWKNIPNRRWHLIPFGQVALHKRF